MHQGESSPCYAAYVQGHHQSSPRYCLYLPADSGRLGGQRFGTAPTRADGANPSQVHMNIHERGEWAGRRALVLLCIEPTAATRKLTRQICHYASVSMTNHSNTSSTAETWSSRRGHETRFRAFTRAERSREQSAAHQLFRSLQGESGVFHIQF